MNFLGLFAISLAEVLVGTALGVVVAMAKARALAYWR